MKFGTCNVRSLHRSGSLTAAARQLETHKLDLVDMQEVRGGQTGHNKSRGLQFFLWKRK